ncbi:PQQ-binding-like beta-propeller repeat protein [bacterium]|nr:PQQ-binding-like beta-propeller repeat protein [bacterium]
MKLRIAMFLISLLFLLSAQTQAQNWPSFRGPHASGTADGKALPIEWNIATSHNIKWKAPIPGLAHSSPIVWGDRVFVTTAVSADANLAFQLASSGRAVTVDSLNLEWKILALDKGSGKIIWEQTAHRGLPRTKRHQKASQCNSTPVTNGQYLAAVMGSEGLYCFDMAGKLIWKKDLGVLDGGYVGRPWFQWGHASSPIIYKNLVIVQIDKFEDSYLAAYDIKSGKEIWSVHRDNVPTWCTPTVFESDTRSELITNGGHYARGYDPLTGKELWRFADRAEVKVPTPIVADGVIYLAGGAPRGRKMFAIRSGASGDISLKAGERSNEHTVWMAQSGGPYTVTPIVHGGYFYSCNNGGILACYSASTGEMVYRTRLGSTFSASPVAANGNLYFASEDGAVFVVKAGPTYELLAKNEMHEGCMATPAISNGIIFIRTRKNVYAIGA